MRHSQSGLWGQHHLLYFSGYPYRRHSGNFYGKPEQTIQAWPPARRLAQVYQRAGLSTHQAAAAPSCALSCCLPASLTPPPSVPSAFPSLLSFFLQNQDHQQCRAARLHGGDGCSPPAGGTPHFRQPPSPRSQGAGAAELRPALRKLGDDGGGDADRPGSVCRSSRTLSPCHTR